MFSRAIVFLLLAATSSIARCDDLCFAPICIVDRPCVYKLPPTYAVAPGKNLESEWFRFEGDQLKGIPTKKGIFYLDSFLTSGYPSIRLTVLDEADARALGECDDERIDADFLRFAVKLLSDSRTTHGHKERTVRLNLDPSQHVQEYEVIKDSGSRVIAWRGPLYYEMSSIQDQDQAQDGSVQWRDSSRLQGNGFEIRGFDIGPAPVPTPQYEDQATVKTWDDIIRSGDSYRLDGDDEEELDSSILRYMRMTWLLHKLAMIGLICGAILTIYTYRTTRKTASTEYALKNQQFV